ncbi:hypothetical protein Pla52n_28620 [Stieleria varia]|uniref:Uncharacterized protein n=1 Tax=Stieleria varia TaxID=2528005 RepID=A0A5C6AYR8_9BACT|nr:hypothetical protein Pla52n_28620 [Stieleria varia]
MKPDVENDWVTWTLCGENGTLGAGAGAGAE